jgi:hypothetical protein
MKNLFLSAIFAVVAFTSNAQVVTITGFGTTTKFGPISSTTTITDVLFDTYEIESEDIPTSYKYIINFSTKRCTLYDALDQEVTTIGFKIVTKKSNRDFQIEFLDPNNEFEDIFGIIAKDTIAAYTQSNGKSVNLTVFNALYIF